ncbi:hypothetical protein BK816_02340 [Boudabousia tangfeifanii]|uniref:Uncharacterized protein n=1 Tax=Boudabousia tangfeifanii TaxID=1912795 RepID=A0A1D9MJ23_9ACTO|nr:hypothetical protein [Boudabousia tangfeifanii]AOZ72282.1 hypothetical protein BK816_02340 [Boudabousia tangfeifanii]
MTEKRERRRRVATYISPADQARLEQGLTPSWAEGPGDGLGDEESSPSASVKSGENDARLLENVPPHHVAH